MSYSRWSNSRWYTYWDTSSGKTQDSQMFTVCGDGHFYYRELKQDINSCLGIVQIVSECTDKELEELRVYMSEFMEDVEAKYESNRAKR